MMGAKSVYPPPGRWLERRGPPTDQHPDQERWTDSRATSHGPGHRGGQPTRVQQGGTGARPV